MRYVIIFLIIFTLAVAANADFFDFFRDTIDRPSTPPIEAGDALLMESGSDFILLENNTDKILLEV